MEIKNEWRKKQESCLLENQQLFNEKVAENTSRADIQLNRCSIPIVRLINSYMKSPELVSFQAMMGVVGVAEILKKGQIDSETLIAKIQTLKCQWSFDAMQDLKKIHELDVEEELKCLIAEEIALEYDRRTISDLRNGAAFRKTIAIDKIKESGECRIGSLVLNFLEEVKKFYGHSCNWMICDEDTGNLLGIKEDPKKEQDSFGDKLGIREIGIHDIDQAYTLKVFYDRLFPTGSILFGYKGDNYDSGYILAPYIPLIRIPIAVDPETLIPRSGLASRLDRKMIDPTYYANLNITGLENKKVKH